MKIGIPAFSAILATSSPGTFPWVRTIAQMSTRFAAAITFPCICTVTSRSPAFALAITSLTMSEM